MSNFMFDESAEYASKALKELLDNQGDLDGLSRPTLTLLDAIGRSDNLGFETPSQALSQISRFPEETLTNFDIDPALKGALTRHMNELDKPKPMKSFGRLGQFAGILGALGLAGAPREAQAQGILEMLAPPMTEAFRANPVGDGTLTEEQRNRPYFQQGK
jgi:hypothetical protein